MIRSIQDKLALLFVPACLFVTAPAFGQSGECAADADCGEGQTCQKAMFVDGCAAPPTDGSGEEPTECNSEPQEAETGYCYTPPTPCEADSECGEYLSCVDSQAGACTVDSDGNTSCEDAPDSTKYCTVGVIACESDDDCPREFECGDVVACLAIDCAEGEMDCPDPCAPSGEKECMPKQIECEETADCPSAWSCVGNVIESCMGGGSAGTPGGSETSEPGVEPDAPADAPDEVTCTTEPAVGSCQPDAYNGAVINYGDDIAEVGLGDDGPGNSGDPTVAPAVDADGENASAGGGCSVARGTQSPDFAWVLSLLVALPLLRRRSVA